MRATAGTRSVHVAAALGRSNGGPTYSVRRLCLALNEAGNRTVLMSVAGDPEESAAEDHKFTIDEEQFPQFLAKVPIARNFRLSGSFRRALAVNAARADLVHDHGLWQAPNLEAGWQAARFGKPLIVTPRGMLSPTALSFSPLRKRWFWRLLQGPAFSKAKCFHATSAAEAEDLRLFGLRQPIAVIPNGIDLPEPAFASETPVAVRTVLALGRIHPKKGLDHLVEAWSRIAGERPEWRLAIVGPDEHGHTAELAALATRIGAARISFPGPAWGDEKLHLYREADLFVLPTLDENFGIVVAESLAAGVPVICTRGAPWQGLDEERCGWWVDIGTEPLAAALRAATALPRGELHAMGARGRAWMERDFGWEAIARSMATVYAWMTGRGDLPACVRVD
jgi:glycosyltransferase involved in cell wall biosynthesis